MIGCPSDMDLIKLLKTSSLPNCPVTPRDVIITNKVFGPDVGALKGKTTWRGPPIVDSPMSVDTTSILEHYGEITLCVNLMYVNKVPLLVTLSRTIKFGTMEAVADRKEVMLLKCIKGVVTLLTEFRQPLQVQSHLEMQRILLQLGHTQRTWKLAPQTDPKWSPTRSLTRFQPICSLSACNGRYACQVSRAHRTHSRL